MSSCGHGKLLFQTTITRLIPCALCLWYLTFNFVSFSSCTVRSCIFANSTACLAFSTGNNNRNPERTGAVSGRFHNAEVQYTHTWRVKFPSSLGRPLQSSWIKVRKSFVVLASTPTLANGRRNTSRPDRETKGPVLAGRNVDILSTKKPRHRRRMSKTRAGLSSARLKGEEPPLAADPRVDKTFKTGLEYLARTSYCATQLPWKPTHCAIERHVLDVEEAWHTTAYIVAQKCFCCFRFCLSGCCSLKRAAPDHCPKLVNQPPDLAFFLCVKDHLVKILLRTVKNSVVVTCWVTDKLGALPTGGWLADLARPTQQVLTYHVKSAHFHRSWLLILRHNHA